MAEPTDRDIAARTEAMRRLHPEDRSAAIVAAPNVIGAGRFADIRRQRDLSDGYRRPRGGGAS